MLIVKNNNAGVAEAIDDLEETYHIKLPDVYKKFLLKYNGGSTFETTVIASRRKTEESIQLFYSIADEKDSLVWLSEMDILEDYLDHDFLPIAEDEYGNMFLLNLSKKNYGEIAFYDHEKRKTQTFSKSFTEFIRNAKSEIFHVTSLEERIAKFQAKGKEVTDEWIQAWQEDIDSYKDMGEQEEVVLDCESITRQNVSSAHCLLERMKNGLFKKKDKDNYGIFIMTKLVNSGQRVQFSWRQEPDDEAGTNGWSLFSGQEDEQDMVDLVLAGMKVVEQIAPGMKEIFNAPVGSEIGWLYDDEGNHVGYYDMVQKKNTTIEEILKNK